MRVNITNIDETSFKVKKKFHEVLREELILVHPQLDGAEWNKDNLIFRSSIWNTNGDLVSAGFPKFFNWGENSELSPVPKNLNSVKILDKFDGSLLIVSKYKGEYIIRVRQSFNTDSLGNDSEVDIFKLNILPKLDNGSDTWDHTYLFEWLSGSHKIIISYKDVPAFKLIGKVHHDDYSLASQDWLNNFAAKHGIDRPKIYTFSSIEELIGDVSAWDGSEGVIIYSNNDQTLHKVKSAWYLKLHRMKSDIASTKKLLLIWENLGRPDYETFYNYIKNQFDYELAEFAKNDIQKICGAHDHLIKLLDEVSIFVKTLPQIRKDAAELIISTYGTNGTIKGIAFDLYSGKTVNEVYVRYVEPTKFRLNFFGEE